MAVTFEQARTMLREIVPTGMIYIQVRLADHCNLAGEAGRLTINYSISVGDHDADAGVFEDALRAVLDKLRSPNPNAEALERMQTLLEGVPRA